MTPELLALLTPEERASWDIFVSVAHPDSIVLNALTTIANLRRDLRDAESAASVEATEANRLRAENATLRETLAEQQRAFIVGLELAQRTADAEIAELRARLTTGIGLPLGVNDRDGNPVHVGDTLAFDGQEWTRTRDAPDHIYTVEFKKGQVLVDGTVSDIPSFCRVVKRWDAPKEQA